MNLKEFKQFSHEDIFTVIKFLERNSDYENLCYAIFSDILENPIFLKAIKGELIINEDKFIRYVNKYDEIHNKPKGYNFKINKVEFYLAKGRGVFSVNYTYDYKYADVRTFEIKEKTGVSGCRQFYINSIKQVI